MKTILKNAMVNMLGKLNNIFKSTILWTLIVIELGISFSPLATALNTVNAQTVNSVTVQQNLITTTTTSTITDTEKASIIQTLNSYVENNQITSSTKSFIDRAIKAGTLGWETVKKYITKAADKLNAYNSNLLFFGVYAKKSTESDLDSALDTIINQNLDATTQRQLSWNVYSGNLTQEYLDNLNKTTEQVKQEVITTNNNSTTNNTITNTNTATIPVTIVQPTIQQNTTTQIGDQITVTQNNSEDTILNTLLDSLKGLSLNNSYLITRIKNAFAKNEILTDSLQRLLNLYKDGKILVQNFVTTIYGLDTQKVSAEDVDKLVLSLENGEFTQTELRTLADRFMRGQLTADDIARINKYNNANQQNIPVQEEATATVEIQQQTVSIYDLIPQDSIFNWSSLTTTQQNKFYTVKEQLEKNINGIRGTTRLHSYSNNLMIISQELQDGTRVYYKWENGKFTQLTGTELEKYQPVIDESMCRITNQIVYNLVTRTEKRVKQADYTVFITDSNLSQAQKDLYQRVKEAAYNKYREYKRYSSSTKMKSSFVAYNATTNEFMLKVKRDDTSSQWWWYKVQIKNGNPYIPTSESNYPYKDSASKYEPELEKLVALSGPVEYTVEVQFYEESQQTTREGNCENMWYTPEQTIWLDPAKPADYDEITKAYENTLIEGEIKFVNSNSNFDYLVGRHTNVPIIITDPSKLSGDNKKRYDSVISQIKSRFGKDNVETRLLEFKDVDSMVIKIRSKDSKWWSIYEYNSGKLEKIGTQFDVDAEVETVPVVNNTGSNVNSGGTTAGGYSSGGMVNGVYVSNNQSISSYDDNYICVWVSLYDQECYEITDQEENVEVELQTSDIFDFIDLSSLGLKKEYADILTKAGYNLQNKIAECVLDGYTDTPDENTWSDSIRNWVDFGVGFVPFAGDAYDVYVSSTGNNVITGRTESCTDRVVRGAFGIIGIGLDVAGAAAVGIGTLATSTATEIAQKVFKEGIQATVKSIIKNIMENFTKEAIEKVLKRVALKVSDGIFKIGVKLINTASYFNIIRGNNGRLYIDTLGKVLRKIEPIFEVNGKNFYATDHLIVRMAERNLTINQVRNMISGKNVQSTIEYFREGRTLVGIKDINGNFIAYDKFTRNIVTVIDDVSPNYMNNLILRHPLP